MLPLSFWLIFDVKLQMHLMAWRTSQCFYPSFHLSVSQVRRDVPTGGSSSGHAQDRGDARNQALGSRISLLVKSYPCSRSTPEEMGVLIHVSNNAAGAALCGELHDPDPCSTRVCMSLNSSRSEALHFLEHTQTCGPSCRSYRNYPRESDLIVMWIFHCVGSSCLVTICTWSDQ